MAFVVKRGNRYKNYSEIFHFDTEYNLCGNFRQEKR